MEHLVDFFIVGEPKSGTTALAQFLSEHPDIGLSTPKEPHYFATDLQAESDAFHHGRRRHFEIRSRRQYDACFDAVRDKKIWGEGSTHYMVSKVAARTIRAYNPNAKIIVMLRSPVKFLHSLHMQYVNNATEDELDFAKALALEPLRKHGHRLPPRTRCPSHLFYMERIRYAEHLKRFYAEFPAEQVHVIISEEFNADNAAAYQKVVAFLGADAAAALPDFRLVHESRAPRSRLAHSMLNNLALKNTVLQLTGPHRYDVVKNKVASVVLRPQERPPIDPHVRAQLMRSSRREVNKIATLLGRDDLPALWGYTAWHD